MINCFSTAPMHFSVFIILASIFIADCAPKLGDILFDPLEFEAAKHIGQGDGMRKFEESSDEDFLENDSSKKITKEPPPVIINQINIQKESKEKIRTKPFVSLLKTESINSNKPVRRQVAQGNEPKFGYEFDPSRCIVLNGDKRVICGYDKNKGDIPQEQPIIPFPQNNDCRIRADRIECGYVQGGYNLARRKALPLTPDVYSKTYTSYSMSRITFPKVSPQLVTSLRIKNMSKSTSNLKLITNSVTPLPTTIRMLLKVANSLTGELASGKMTTTLLTSRSGIVSSKITAENKHRDTLPEPSIILEDITPSLKMDKSSTLYEQQQITKMLEVKPIVRTDENNEAPNFGGCLPCALKKGLRGPDVEGTTSKSATRCVEISDRIVCYPIKARATTPIVAP